MGKVYFKPLPIRRLSELIEESIRELIARGELEPGSRLPSEKDIGKQFGVSVVTVREALRGLEAFGIIQKKRGRDGGVFVADSSRHWAAKTIYSLLISKKISARHVGEVRKIIQPACAKIAASRISPQELESPHENIKYCENRLRKQKSDSISESAFFHIEERNVEFHRLIAEATYNPVLALTADYVEDFLLSAKKPFLFLISDLLLRRLRNTALSTITSKMVTHMLRKIACSNIVSGWKTISQVGRQRQKQQTKKPEESQEVIFYQAPDRGPTFW